MAQLNLDFAPNENESKKDNEATPKGSSSKRLIAIFAATIAALLIVLWIFSGDGSAQNSDANLSAAASDKNLTKENTQVLAPPPLSSEVVSMQTAPSASANTRETTKKDENLSSLFDDQAIKAAIERPDTSVPEEKETKQINTPEEQDPLSSQDQQDRSEIQNQNESKLEKLKNEIRMKKNFFSLNGENFYEGDTILGYKIKEITKENVVLQENNGEIINLNFRSKK
jgi:hypothetical protein